MQNYISKTLPKIEKAVSEVFPKEISEGWNEENMVKLNYEFNLEIWEEAFGKPFYELFNRGGKRLRPVLACLVCESFGGGRAVTREQVTCTEDLIYKLATIPEILHTGTLMIDDIEDKSDLRRGQPTVHKMFAENLTINSGNFLYYFPQLILKNVEISAEKKLKIYEVISEEMTKLHLGQGMDILWSNQKKYDVSVKEYLQMSEYKTGTLLNLAFQIGGILSNQTEEVLLELKKLAYKIGVAFQVQDDVLNLKDGDKWGKTYGEDIREGKLTYLVVRTFDVIRNSKFNIKNDQEELIDILEKENNSQEEIKQAVELIEKNRTFEKANRFCEKLINEAREIVESFGFEGEYLKIWEEVLLYVIKRKK